MEHEIIMDALKVVIAIVIVIITKHFIPWLKSKNYYENIVNISALVRNYVQLAEAVITGNKKGLERHDMVSDLLVKKAEEFNLNFTKEDIDALIESAYNDCIKYNDYE